MVKVFWVFIMSLVIYACYDLPEKKMSRKELNDIVETQGRAMLSNSLVYLNNASYFARKEITDLPGLFILSPWGFRYEGESSVYDSIRYNRQTQYWSVRVEQINQAYELQYRYEWPDQYGNPTSKTNALYFEFKYKTKHTLSSSSKIYDVDGTSRYTIQGIKNYYDPSSEGKLYYSGSTISHFSYQFSQDTVVEFMYRDIVRDVVLVGQNCIPTDGYFEYTMAQNAEPGAFTIEQETDKDWNLLKRKDVPNQTFKDYEFRGKTLFTKESIHVLADGEDFEILMPCDSIQGLMKANK